MKTRNRSFDVLRGVAILLVLGRHYDYRYIRIWHSIGWAGVDLFFVLSGFLISGLLFSEYKNTGYISIRRFWTRRALKIYPPFYILILLTVAYCWFAYRSIPYQVLGDIFFLQNYAPRLWGHGWSLAIEEHFYIALPLLLAAMIRISKNKGNPFRSIPMISVGLTVLCLFLRISASHRTVHWEELAFPTHLRVDALFAGVTLGYYHHFDAAALKLTRRWPMFLAGVLVMLPAFLFEGTTFTTTIGLTFTFIGCSCIVIFALNQKPAQNPVSKFVAWVGRYSYSIYLWHALPALYVFEKLPQSPWMCGAYFFVCIGFGVVMAKLIEVPALHLRDRYFPSPRIVVKVKTSLAVPGSELRPAPCVAV
jgi:peptidoglycan/LPS O-acetylase OafA/YrhL